MTRAYRSQATGSALRRLGLAGIGIALVVALLPTIGLAASQAAPTISGETPTITEEASRLICHPGNWTPLTAQLSFQWLRDGVPLSNETLCIYRLTKADVGSRLAVQVTGTLDGQSLVKVSSETNVVTPVGCSRGTPTTPMRSFTLGADMNSDTRGEILAVDANGVLWMFPGSRTGRLSPACEMGTGTSFADMQVFGPGNIDSRRSADILAVSADGRLWLYPDLWFGSPPTKTQVGSGWSGWRLIPAGDLDQDGTADLLGINSAGLLFMYAGRGDGTFKPRRQVGSGWKGWNLYAAGDLNGDGKADILGINAKGELFQYLGKGNGMFYPRKQVGYGWTGFTLASGADLTGDGLADIVGRDNSSHVLYFYKGKGGGGFAARQQIATNW